MIVYIWNLGYSKRLRQKDLASSGVWDQPGQHSKTLYQKSKQNNHSKHPTTTSEWEENRLLVTEPPDRENGADGPTHDLDWLGWLNMKFSTRDCRWKSLLKMPAKYSCAYGRFGDYCLLPNDKLQKTDVVIIGSCIQRINSGFGIWDLVLFGIVSLGNYLT